MKKNDRPVPVEDLMFNYLVGNYSNVIKNRIRVGNIIYLFLIKSWRNVNKTHSNLINCDSAKQTF